MKVLELTFYSVTSEGVIIVPDIPEPKTRSDVFERVDTRDVHTRQELIELIESCPPLEQHFLDLSLAYLQVHAQLSSFVDNLVAQRGRRSGAQQLILRALRRNPDGGWRQWIEYSGDAALEVFLQHVRDWLDEKIDWNESDYFDAMWNGQATALSYFEDLPNAILKALGVRIVDGDVPGSSYRAAELRKGLDEANQMAELLELDLRFEAEISSSCEVDHE
jgi:hypothetical protein